MRRIPGAEFRLPTSIRGNARETQFDLAVFASERRILPPAACRFQCLIIAQHNRPEDDVSLYPAQDEPAQPVRLQPLISAKSALYSPEHGHRGPVKLMVRNNICNNSRSAPDKESDETCAAVNATDRFCAAGLSRRTFLASVAALGASIAFPHAGSAANKAGANASDPNTAGPNTAGSNSAGAKTAGGPPHRIDIHSHITPPSYSADLGPKHLLSPPALGWTLAKFLEEMDEGGVATSITSLPPPGVWTGDDLLARSIARGCNDYAARLITDHPGRFGMFAALPLPDIAGSLREIAYAFDELKADGVAMFTNYGDKWLGDPFFAPVFEELNRRKAVAYTHPKAANCCKNVLAGINDSNIEYATDTTRAIAQIVFNGVSTRYPDVRMIFSHAGGTMPFLSERFVTLAKSPEFAQRLPQGFLAETNKFYYDTAQSTSPAAIAALLRVVPVSQIVFGTDYPFGIAAPTAQELKECGLLKPKDLRAIDRENALRLLPKYRT